MPSPGDMISAIASRSYDDSDGSRMRSFREETEREKHGQSVQRIIESADGRALVERVRGAEQQLARILVNAPAGSIPTAVKKQLEAIHQSIMV